VHRRFEKRFKTHLPTRGSDARPRRPYAVSPEASGIAPVGTSKKPVAAPTGEPPTAQQEESLISDTLTKQEFSDNGRGVAAKKTTSTPELDAKHSSTEWPMSTEIPNFIRYSP
jgi:hypothetical protein